MKIEIGKIVKVVGIKGQVKVYSYSDDSNRFSKLKTIFIGNDEYEILSSRNSKTPVLSLKNVTDRNMAEALVNKSVFMKEEDLEELPKGSYYIKDIIGFKVIDNTLGMLGHLEDVLTGRVQDLYKVKGKDGKDFFFPGVKEFIIETSTEENVIRVNLPKGILEI